MNDQSALPVYAITRLTPRLVDLQAIKGNSNAPEVSTSVTVKKIVASVETAKKEVDRLNELNGDKGCHYYWQHTRLYSDDLEEIIAQANQDKA
jgi:hypothetical protein